MSDQEPAAQEPATDAFAALMSSWDIKPPADAEKEETPDN